MDNQNNSRRNFIRKAAIGGLLAVSIPEIVTAAMVPSATKKKTLIKYSII